MKLENNFNYREVAKITSGYVGADIESLSVTAAMIAVKNKIKEEKYKEENIELKLSDFIEAQKKIQPSAMREGFSIIPNVNWEDVGALAELRKELEMSIVNPILNPQIYLKVGITSPVGILLFGPPGCGKTLLAKAVSHESNANFISIKGPELLNKFVGESEKAIRQLFFRARASAPCIIFFDELDAICPKRGIDNNMVTERLVNQLLTELDGIENRGKVYVIGATNRPDIIDKAMRRPGRFDKSLLVPLPNEEDRISIIKALTRKSPIDESVKLEKVAKDQRCKV